MATVPLSSRPLDLIYFVFFLVHLPASFLIDCQPIYPASLVPGFIRGLVKMYTDSSADPLISGVMGYSGESRHFIWLMTYIFLEIFFQVPVFILGMRGLWKDSRSIYLLLFVYGASTATTALPCLTVLLSTPTTSGKTIAAGVQSVTDSQRFVLLASYLPFFLLPFIMAIDMARRISKLLRAGEVAGAKKKSCISW